MKINWVNIGLAILLVLLLIKLGCNQTSLNDALSIGAAKDDTIHILKNKLGQETASRITFQSSADFFKRQMKHSNDSLIQKLISEINKNTISLTHTKTVTASGGRDWPEVSFDQGDTCDPIYHKTFISEWDSVDITAGRKEIKFGYEVYNEFRIEQSVKSNGLFKRKDLLVSVTNANPHTKTLGLQSFHVSYPAYKIGIGPLIGIGFNNSFMPIPFVGIGIQYSLLRL